MMKFTVKAKLLAGCFLLLFAGSAFAGTAVNLSVGRGESHSMAYNLGVTQSYEPLLSGSLGELIPTAELNGSLWVPDSGDDDNVWGVGFAPGLKFVMFSDAAFNPFLAASVGGVVISEDNMGPRELGGHVLFKSKGTVGVEFGDANQHRIQGEYTNHSTWGLTSSDAGYNTYGATYGYSF